ncbi:MAG: hypothetical protein ACHQ51_04685 [Elusimicrobiota bacterium]
MGLQILLLAAGVAFAGPSAKPAPLSPVEETLAGKLSQLRQERVLETRQAVLGGAEDLRDAVASGAGSVKKQLADRFPGMSQEPFDLCRDLARCREAPQSLHVDEDFLTDDAFLALARPWIKLQEARGKAVKLTVDPGLGVRLELEDMPALPVVTLTATPTPTGGFDVAVEDAPDAARVFAAARGSILGAKN